MWLLKKATTKVNQISQKVLKQDSESEKLIKDIISNKHTVMPIKKMSQLSSMSYESEHFEKIVSFVSDKLQDIKMQRKSLKKRLNLLVLISYLIKHGASGFIDQFRAIKDSFTKYEILVVTQSQEDRQLHQILLELSERAHYIKTLLTDKEALGRQKEIARVIKEKLMVQKGGDYSQMNRVDSENKEEKAEKVQSFLQHYVWRYAAKIDQKLDAFTDKLIDKIDEYLDGELPQSFQIDQLQTEVKKEMPKDEPSGAKKAIEEEQKFIKDKLPLEELVNRQDLIDFADESNQAPKHSKTNKKEDQNVEYEEINPIRVPQIKQEEAAVSKKKLQKNIQNTQKCNKQESCQNKQKDSKMTLYGQSELV